MLVVYSRSVLSFGARLLKNPFLSDSEHSEETRLFLGFSRGKYHRISTEQPSPHPSSVHCMLHTKRSSDSTKCNLLGKDPRFSPGNGHREFRT